MATRRQPGTTTRARSATTSTTPTRRRSPARSRASVQLNPDVVRSIVGIVLLITGAVTLIALILPGQGRLTDLWRDSIAPWFGSGRWLLPFVLLAAGWYVERSRRNSAAWTARLLGGGLMFISILGLIELFSPSVSGGRIGDFLYGILSGLITSPGAFVLLAGGAVVGLLIMLDTPLRQLLAPFSGWAHSVSTALTTPDRADDTDRATGAKAASAGAAKAAAVENPPSARGSAKRDSAGRGGDSQVHDPGGHSQHRADVVDLRSDAQRARCPAGRHGGRRSVRGGRAVGRRTVRRRSQRNRAQPGAGGTGHRGKRHRGNP